MRRPGVAVIRGLLLDWLATGDRAGVDAAFECYITAMSPGPLPGQAVGDPPPRQRSPG